MSTGSAVLIPIKKRKTRICLWKDLTIEDVEILQKAKSVDEIHRALSQMLSLERNSSDPRVSVLLDLYYYTVRFCQDSGFNREQTSCLFSIVKDTHAECTDTPLGNMDMCYEHFVELLLCHSVHRPPFSLAIFTQQQIQTISDYVMNTYFRQFKLYKYVFTPQVHLDLSISYQGMVDPNPVADSEQDILNLNISSEETDLQKEGKSSAGVEGECTNGTE